MYKSNGFAQNEEKTKTSSSIKSGILSFEEWKKKKLEPASHKNMRLMVEDILSNHGDNPPKSVERIKTLMGSSVVLF